ncbi:hypothetical protein B296_00023453 [Ensete ventricosum]|uniref:Uncharacterized protein n=1 Tax=Ensete ventricosum TaxID=4639 RepID=A0A426Y0C6_ENSVE|nr:hypothetical protein B296_00023453 [Ensete ventricosum]
MGRVTYEYGYRVALAHFHALHSDSEVEEDPFTIHPEDDLVLMERPMCASSLVVVSAQNWSSGWGKKAPGPAGEVRSGRPLVPVGRSVFIATVTGYPYLNLLSSLLLTIPLLFTTPSVVLAARRARLQLRDVDLAHLTCVRSVVRPLTPLCPC